MNKKFLVSILSALSIFSFWAGSACATTYYVRLDGGTALECTGTADAPYPGSGTGRPCAFIHPRYALGWGCTNGGNSCANGGLMQGGDTLYIDGDDPTNGGVQAQYEIGYDDTNNDETPGCSSSWPYDCTLGNLPAGINTSQRTSIIGTGNHKPQLWGTQRVWQVLNADNNHIWLQNLEITDHDNCAYNSPDKGCNYGGPYPYGQWGEDGLYIGGDDVNVTDVYIHGMGRYGVNTDNFGSATFTRFNVIGNGFAGISTGINAVISGTMTFNQPIIEWNGCVESFPLNTTSPVDSPSNFSDCFGQNQNGYGDGLAYGNVGHGNAGNWTIYGPGSISFNTQDGLDTLHGNGNGTIQIDKMRFEGNAGNQVKMNALTSILTNSVVIGDCGWWLGSAQSSPGFASGDICRALGDAVLINVTLNSQTYLYNNTVVSNGNVALETEDLNGTGCNGSTMINAKNNIVLGGYTWIDDTIWNGSGGNSLTTFIYNDGSDGNGSGSCGALGWNEDYNIVYGTKNNNQGCLGAHDKCGTIPGFTGTIPMGTVGGGASTYYQGNSAATLVSLNSNSPAIASGAAGLTFWNDGNDYHNVVRSNPPSRGGLELNSCAANGYGCFFDSDCCNGTACTNFLCGGNGNGNTNATPPVTTSGGATSQLSVNLTAPGNGNTFASGTNVTITAAASEANGNISQVAFYDNGTTLLGTAATPPYEFIATNLPAGSNSLTAVATDTNGNSTTSSSITVTVTAPTGQTLPQITLTNPTSGSAYTGPSNITVTATASESNGTIAQVQFFDGVVPLNYVGTSPPYSYVWNNVLPGTYTMTAQAVDSNGVAAISAPVTITVGSANTAPASPQTTNSPVVTLTSPAGGSNFSGVSNIALSASASETNGTIAQVKFFNGGTPLSYTGTSSPYSYVWTNVQPGTYSITAQATDSNGAVTASTPVTITVTAVNNSPTSSPTVTIASPAGNNFSGVSNITLTASAAEANGTIAQVKFYNGAVPLSYTGTATPYSYVWNNVQPGTYTMTAQVIDSNGVAAVSEPLTLTVTSTAGSPTNPPAVAIISPANGSSFSGVSNITLNASASETNGTIAQVRFLNGIIPLSYTGTGSPYSYVWNNVQPGTYTLTAQAVDSNGVVTASAPVTITVNAAQAPALTNPEEPPAGETVSLTSPGSNSSYTVPASILLTSAASESGATIARVDYYAGSIYLGEATSSPYAVTWTSAQAGTYILLAKATDTAGNSFYSSPVSITVTGHTAPSITLTAPVNNAAYNIPANIILTANASANGGTITKVDFYSPPYYLGTALSAPYTINWNNVLPGNYSITAKATDNYGWSTTSAPVNVTVMNSSPGLTTVLTPLANIVNNALTPVVPPNSNDVSAPSEPSVPLDSSSTVLTSSDSAPLDNSTVDTTSDVLSSSNNKKHHFWDNPQDNATVNSTVNSTDQSNSNSDVLSSS